MYEIKATDLLGRVGILNTPSGKIITPAVLPVVHPLKQEIPSQKIREIGFEALMTNAYTLHRRLGRNSSKGDVHQILNFHGPVMTDSGGYQLLEYGDIELAPREIAEFQLSINSDICVILDNPTGSEADKKRAKETVTRTFEAAKASSEFYESSQLWTGPIQGGRYLDLISLSCRLMKKFPFDIYALGSPTQVMEGYDFVTLIEMIRTAKRSIPLDKPFHLFGAGHPLTLPLAVALGCDMFDSASYMLYARQGRYITRTGTKHILSVEYFACSCPVCKKFSPSELREIDKQESVRFVAEHNLYTVMEEVSAIRQSIQEATLWEYLVQKAISHPKVFGALHSVLREPEDLINGTPIVKDVGAFVSIQADHSRPELSRFRSRVKLLSNLIEKDSSIAVILSCPKETVWYKSEKYIRVARRLQQIGRRSQSYLFHRILGLIPLEVADVYPAGQLVVGVNEEDSDESQQLLHSELKKLGKYKKIILYDAEKQFVLRSKLPNVVLCRSEKKLMDYLDGDPLSID
jgi:7-cyano-7-deazaguanine tRNA-ribosyltransferase